MAAQIPDYCIQLYVNVEHERLRPRSFWATRAARVCANVVFRIGVGAWVVAIIGVLLMLMSFAVIVLVALVKPGPANPYPEIAAKYYASQHNPGVNLDENPDHPAKKRRGALRR
jgi:hypothetical protein